MLSRLLEEEIPVRLERGSQECKIDLDLFAFVCIICTTIVMCISVCTSTNTLTLSEHVGNICEQPSFASP